MPYTRKLSQKFKSAFPDQAQYRHAETLANQAMVVCRQLEWTGRHGPAKLDC
jgi:hypothetical protein